ncbi:phage holin family protein [Weissella diestrammenae]|uniref:Phage holin family protein n=1 Tax=Weissella diestrammenae TaxID=1162633 RepID=A0A7G9T6B5_9LACO|nr:phage holin family protein [Weissella diestrammenae]MCM0583314.1 phage holin family protein [Weissella diestrammenae]QNN75640.1 phage holin family protein [Weissella diestrammenae]
MTFRRFSFLQRLIINTVMFLALAGLFPQGMYVENLWTAVLAAFVLGFLNAFVRPVLHFLSLPLTIISMGLFAFIINAFVLWLTSWVVGTGFQFTSFGWAVLISIIMSLVNAILSSYFNRE